MSCDGVCMLRLAGSMMSAWLCTQGTVPMMEPLSVPSKQSVALLETQAVRSEWVENSLNSIPVPLQGCKCTDAIFTCGW